MYFKELEFGLTRWLSKYRGLLPSLTPGNPIVFAFHAVLELQVCVHGHARHLQELWENELKSSHLPNKCFPH